MVAYGPHEHSLRCWWNHDDARWVCPPEQVVVLPTQVRLDTEVPAAPTPLGS